MSVSINNFYRTERPPVSKTVGGVEPDWDIIPHSNMTSLSKTEIISLVKELAVQDNNATTNQEKDKIARKVQELFCQYASSASPDRKSLYENAIKTIKEQGGADKKQDAHINRPQTLFDYLNERDGIGMKFDKAYSISGGGAVTASYVTGGGARFDISYQGESILCINSDGSVSYAPTAAEQKLTKEIANIYYRERDNANSMQSQTNNFVADGSIDIIV